MTNRQEVNGASVLLYDDVLQTVALKKKTDFYILPSSIHEVILVPSDRIDNPSDLFTMVEDCLLYTSTIAFIPSGAKTQKKEIIPYPICSVVAVFKMRMSILNTATTEQMGYGIISFFVCFL